MVSLVKQYLKISNFKTFVKENEVDLITMSESWERPDETLEKVVNMKNFTFISNPHQRKNVGGRPAIFVNNTKYNVENLINTQINIPWGLEIIWLWCLQRLQIMLALSRE